MKFRRNLKVFDTGIGSNQHFDSGHLVLRIIPLIIDSIILGIIAWMLP